MLYTWNSNCKSTILHFLKYSVSWFWRQLYEYVHLPKVIKPYIYMGAFFFFFFCFLGLHPKHLEIPRLGVESDLQLLAIATATQDPSRVCDLHHRDSYAGSPILSEPREQTATSWLLVGFISAAPQQELPTWVHFIVCKLYLNKVNLKKWFSKKQSSPNNLIQSPVTASFPEVEWLYIIYQLITIYQLSPWFCVLSCLVLF